MTETGLPKPFGVLIGRAKGWPLIACKVEGLAQQPALVVVGKPAPRAPLPDYFNLMIEAACDDYQGDKQRQRRTREFVRYMHDAKVPVNGQTFAFDLGIEGIKLHFQSAMPVTLEIWNVEKFVPFCVIEGRRTELASGAKSGKLHNIFIRYGLYNFDKDRIVAPTPDLATVFRRMRPLHECTVTPANEGVYWIQRVYKNRAEVAATLLGAGAANEKTNQAEAAATLLGAGAANERTNQGEPGLGGFLRFLALVLQPRQEVVAIEDDEPVATKTDHKRSSSSVVEVDDDAPATPTKLARRKTTAHRRGV